MPYATADDELDYAAMLPICRRLERSIDRVAKSLSRIEDSALAAAEEALDRRVNRIVAGCHRLTRILQRREIEERDPNDPRLKRRLPQVLKTMTAPTWGVDFLRRANDARKAGPDALRRLCEAERAAGHLEF